MVFLLLPEFGPFLINMSVKETDSVFRLAFLGALCDIVMKSRCSFRRMRKRFCSMLRAWFEIVLAVLFFEICTVANSM